jgi:hypothetical protein
MAPALIVALLEGFADGEPDGAADGVEVAWGESDRSDAPRILDRLAAVEVFHNLEGDTQVVLTRNNERNRAFGSRGSDYLRV